jgi:hypothetical protein
VADRVHRIGDRSEYVDATRRGQEASARAEKAALAELAQEANQPLHLPSIEEVTALATDLEARLTGDPELGRAALRRWLNDGVIRVDQSPDGTIAKTELLPLMVLVNGAEQASTQSGSPRNPEIPGGGSFSRDFRLLSIRSGGEI